MALLGVALLVDVVRTAGAAALAQGRPDIALSLQPSQPDALLEKARRILSADPTPEAASRGGPLALRAFKLAPLDVRTVRTAGIAAEASGNIVQAEKLMTTAAAMSWRDDATSLWVLNRGLQTNDLSKALDQADALLRRDGARTEEVHNVLQALYVSVPQAEAEIAKHASTAPWRAEFIARATTQPENTGRVYGLMLQARDAGVKLTNTELELLLNAFVNQRAFDQAYLAWVLLSPESQSDGYVFDASFSHIQAPLPFNWALFGGNGATVVIQPSARGRQGVLGVRYSGVLSAPLARQLVLLPPGRYRLRGLESTGENAERLSWEISCAGDDRVLKSYLSHDTRQDWTAFETSFEISADCPAQWLTLRTNLAGGPTTLEAAFDDLSIDQGPSA